MFLTHNGSWVHPASSLMGWLGGICQKTLPRESDRTKRKMPQNRPGVHASRSQSLHSQDTSAALEPKPTSRCPWGGSSQECRPGNEFVGVRNTAGQGTGAGAAAVNERMRGDRGRPARARRGLRLRPHWALRKRTVRTPSTSHPAQGSTSESPAKRNRTREAHAHFHAETSVSPALPQRRFPGNAHGLGNR